jgi:hypothetical protein
MGRTAAGSLAGAALMGWIAPMIRPWFAPPSIGVGMVTVNAYPKSWDYAVVALIVAGAFAGGCLAVWGALRRGALPVFASVPSHPPRRRRGLTVALSLVVFVVMLFVHDHPHAPMDSFHEGEHLTPAWLMKTGERPYRDFYVFHGLTVDAGLGVLSLGDPPSFVRARRVRTVLDAAVVALLVPIAAEVTTTALGLAAGVLLSLCASAALWVPVFPYYRLAPALLATLGFLLYSRTSRVSALALALCASTLGVLWSLDVGLYAVACSAVLFVLFRVFRLDGDGPGVWRRWIACGLVAAVLPLVVLLLVRADLQRFFVDSFGVMPRAIDAVWGLPAPALKTANGLRYFAPLVFYGFALALGVLAFRRGDRRSAIHIAVLVVVSLFLFRTAAGRAGWSHTRFAMPLLGIAVVAFVLEPLARRRRIASGVAVLLLLAPLFLYFEVRENLVAGAKLASEWRARQSTAGLVPYPTRSGRGGFTYPQNAQDLASLQATIDALGPKDAKIFDFSNERALYFLLQRKSPTRSLAVPMMSVPSILAETMAELNADPPVAVIVRGDPSIASFDGVSNDVRVPELLAWIDANYPTRTQIGRFTLATR